MDSFPFINDILTCGTGTLYVLSDYPARLRDGASVLALTRFFAARNIDLAVRAVEAQHRRYQSLWAITNELREGDADELSGKEDVVELIEKLFSRCSAVDESREDETLLAPRGPIVVVGRPQLYPELFLKQIAEDLSIELSQIAGRFEMVNSTGTGDQFWQVRDHRFDLTIPRQPAARDVGVVRKLLSSRPNRSFLFVYGASSLGTYAASQVVIDDEFDQELKRLDVRSFLTTQGTAEVLVGVDLLRGQAPSTGDPHAKLIMQQTMGNLEIHPKSVSVLAGPTSEISRDACECIRWFDSAKPPEEYEDLYQCRDRDTTSSTFEVLGRNGNETESLPWRMIGGRRIRECYQKLESLATSDPPVPVLLTGPTGAGKEMGARVVYQTRVMRLLERLRDGSTIFPEPLVVGARFTNKNCAGTRDSHLAESEYFGVVHGTATEVRARPGAILEAGEGVAFLDELQFLSTTDQGRLLRVVQPPYGVAPVGSANEIPSSCQIVAAMSKSPDALVAEGQMLPELFARFREGVVRIPGLAERPGDIPALLAEFAGEEIEIESSALRSLLTAVHPYNVRGLKQIVEEARARRDEGETLRISIDMLDESESYSNMLRFIERTSKDIIKAVATSRIYRFRPRRNRLPPVAGSVFELAARALTATSNDTNEEISVRRRKAGYEKSLKADEYSVAELNSRAEGELTSCTQLLRDAFGYCRLRASEEEKASLFATIYVLTERRFGSPSSKNSPSSKARLGLVKLLNAKRDVTPQDLSLAFGMSLASISNLKKAMR